MKRPQRILAITVASGLALSLLLFSAPSASAHVVESDGGIAAVLHMPPDDAPTAGENTYVGLAFSSDASSFDINAYDTKIVIQRGDTTVQTATLITQPESNRDGNVTVVFPQAGAYRIIATGTPRQSGETFQLTYNVRATSSIDVATSDTVVGIDFWILSSGSLLLLIIAAQYNIRRGKRYQ